jgi:transcriptional regulator with XRE-family HTH domain
MERSVDALAGDALRAARNAAGGISQADLARRSGVPRTVIVEVERGRRQPSLPTLAGILSGTGYRPTIGLVALPAATDHRGAATDSAHAAPSHDERSAWPRPALDDPEALLERARAVLDVLSLADAIRFGKQRTEGYRRR